MERTKLTLLKRFLIRESLVAGSRAVRGVTMFEVVYLVVGSVHIAQLECKGLKNSCPQGVPTLPRSTFASAVSHWSIGNWRIQRADLPRKHLKTRSPYLQPVACKTIPQ